LAGVAVITEGMDDPIVINSWPGPVVVSNKVPTKVCYRSGRASRVGKPHCEVWGHECPKPPFDRGIDVMENFKLYLDEYFLEQDQDYDRGLYVEWTIEDIELWYTDFLSALYNHIGEKISSRPEFHITDFAAMHIEYIFSFPTAWKDDVVLRFEKLIRRAGFGSERAHEVKIGPTEAEAVAVYTARYSDKLVRQHTKPLEGTSPVDAVVRKGDILLICDSGGGTTVCIRICQC
jgi:hypothetical protein